MRWFLEQLWEEVMKGEMNYEQRLIIAEVKSCHLLTAFLLDLDAQTVAVSEYVMWTEQTGYVAAEAYVIHSD